jgi:hypothetical protein
MVRNGNLFPDVNVGPGKSVNRDTILNVGPGADEDFSACTVICHFV